MTASPAHRIWAERLQGRPARIWRALLLASACGLALGACTSGMQIIGMTPVAAADPVHTIRLSRAVIAAGPEGNSVTLPAGSQWRRVGALPEGDVYRSASGPFTLQPRRQGEAYLVASSGRLLGFYLPSESAYLALSRSVILPVGMRQ